MSPKSGRFFDHFTRLGVFGDPAKPGLIMIGA